MPRDRAQNKAGAPQPAKGYDKTDDEKSTPTRFCQIEMKNTL